MALKNGNIIKERRINTRQVIKAINSAKDMMEKPWKTCMRRTVSVGLISSMVVFAGAAGWRFGPLAPWVSSKFRQMEMMIKVEFAPKAANASPTVAKKDISDLTPALIKVKKAEQRAEQRLRAERKKVKRANHVIDSLKEELATAELVASNSLDSGNTTTTMGTAAHVNLDSIWGNAFPQVPTPLEVYGKAPACVQDYLTYYTNNQTSESRIRINLAKVMGGDERQLEIMLDARPIEISGNDNEKAKTCIIRLRDRKFTIVMEKKGGLLSKTYTGITILTDYSTHIKMAHITVGRNGTMDSEDSNISELGIKGISVN